MTNVNRINNRRQIIAEMNVVPYIDVMLVLLIIFMATAPVLLQGVKVELPKTIAAPVTSNKLPLIVTIDKKNQVYLNTNDKPNESISLHYLLVKLAAELQRDKRQQVLVKGDINANYGQVIAIMAVLQRSGISNIGLITDNDKIS